MFYVSPQLNFTLTKKCNISVMADIPVYQYYNEIQLSNKYAFVVNVIKDFYKKDTEEPVH